VARSFGRIAGYLAAEPIRVTAFLRTQVIVTFGKPVLVVWGEQDVLTPTAANVERYRQAGLTPTIIPKVGHSPMVEAPGEFVNAITEFIQ
jgi:pimeloyl-ACP methyl ester carboxylesterase